jgi:hypothetical protein
MFRKILAAAILVGLTAEANAALSTGDLAFTAFNADEDGWVLTTFKDIDANTTIYFSDNTWTGSAFNATESFHAWNTGASSITAGTVIRFSQIDAPTRSASIGSFSGSGSNFGMSATSETIYAYLGSSQNAPTTFLTAVSSESDTTSLNNAGLSAGVNAIKLTNSTDYAEYIGTRSGLTSFLGYQALVNNPSNWKILVGGDQSLKVPNTDNFSAVPLPGAAWLFSSVVAGFTLIRRRENQHG